MRLNDNLVSASYDQCSFLQRMLSENVEVHNPEITTAVAALIYCRPSHLPPPPLHHCDFLSWIEQRLSDIGKSEQEQKSSLVILAKNVLHKNQNSAIFKGC